MSTAPAAGRGGAANPLAQLKSKKGLRKAPESSVVKDMGADVAAVDEAPEPPVLAAAPPVLESVATQPEAPVVLAPAVTAPDEPAVTVEAPSAPDVPARPASKTATVEKKKMGVWIPAEVVERVRNAYGPTSRLEGHRSLSDLAARALEAEVTRLEEKYNDGQPFPPDEIGIPRGRPLR
ncbi:hypothetical protein [Arthrobacter sp. B0490]|uniref:ParB family protein n=1 Tax=Arthrobacter sp. B0490 TaxID=2058891 RepID=UPI000CE3D296|nr:hypothetical protein [Arthrobacter sp. B0490]